MKVKQCRVNGLGLATAGKCLVSGSSPKLGISCPYNKDNRILGNTLGFSCFGMRKRWRATSIFLQNDGLTS